MSNPNTDKMKRQISLLLALACFIAAPVRIIAQHTAGYFEALNPIPEGKAVVYIYRVSSYAAAIHYKVNANDEPVMHMALYIDGYMVYLADPGKLELWAQMGKHREGIDLDVVAGKSYFVEGSVVSDSWTSMPHFTLVPKDKALKQIHKCKRLVE